MKKLVTLAMGIIAYAIIFSLCKPKVPSGIGNVK